MRILMRLALIVVFIISLSALMYFISFNINPYNLCIDHPNPKYKADYFQCKFGPMVKVIKKSERDHTVDHFKNK